ncbi:MAG TPA: S8 family serine peptidase, partial [Candidatus Thermoplasmatota archaeon]|nr:S8 family serine peptidase [Candidatus Thermoplasmatota archaeon]
MRTPAPNVRANERTPSRLPALVIAGAMLLPTLLAFAGNAAAEPSADEPWFLARFTSAAVVPNDDEFALRGAYVLYRFHAIPAVLLAGPEDTIRSFELDPRVQYVERDQPIEFFLQTATFATNAADVWGDLWWPVASQVQRKDPSPIEVDGVVIDGTGVTVGIVDTGINALHPDLWYAPLNAVPGVTPFQSKVLVCTNVPGLITPEPDNPDCDQTIGHGTHVAGIVAGNGWAARQGLAPLFTNPNAPPVGAAPGAMLAGAGLGAGDALLGLAGGVFFTDVALDWMGENKDKYGIQVVTNSWGAAGACSGNFVTNSITEISNSLINVHDIVVLFAAGNEGGGIITSPYAVNPTPGLITVANYDDLNQGTRAGRISADSSNGCTSTGANNPTGKDHLWTWPDVAAPGSNILSTSAYTSQIGIVAGTPPPFYSTISGTSMATPHVAGVVALIRQANPDLTPAEIEAILIKTATRWTDGVSDQGRAGTVMWNADPNLCHVSPADAAKARAGDTSVNTEFPRFTELALLSDPEIYVCRDFKRGAGLVDAYAAVMMALGGGDPPGVPMVKIESPLNGASVPATPLTVSGLVDRSATGAPTASLSASPTSGAAPLDVTFTLGASDSDGTIASWSLTFGDATPASSGSGSPPATVAHTYAAAGSFTATLTVTDNDDLTALATAAVTATPSGDDRVLWLVGDGTNTVVTDPNDLANDHALSPAGNGGLESRHTAAGPWSINAPENSVWPVFITNDPVTFTGQPVTVRTHVDYNFPGNAAGNICPLRAQILTADGSALIGPTGGGAAYVQPGVGTFREVSFTITPTAGTYAGIMVQFGAGGVDCGTIPYTWIWGTSQYNGRLVLAAGDSGGGPGPLSETPDPIGDATARADIVATDIVATDDGVAGLVRFAQAPSLTDKILVVVNGVEFDARLYGGLVPSDELAFAFSIPTSALDANGVFCTCVVYTVTKVPFEAGFSVEDYAPDSPGVVSASGEVGTDPAGDALIPGMDITAFTVHDETTTSFQVTLQVPDLASAPDSTFSVTGLPPPFVQRPIPFGLENVYSVVFEYDESPTNNVKYAVQAARYFVRADASGDVDQQYTGFTLSAIGGSQYSSMGTTTGTWDAAGGKITWVVPKASMKAKDAPTSSADTVSDLTGGATPTAGKHLMTFTAEARSWIWAGAGSGPSVTIWDSAIGSGTYTFDGGDSPPTATISADPSTGSAPLPVTFALTASDAGGIASWTLDFGDLTTADGGSGAPPATVAHTYTAEGAFTATFVVTDTAGQSTTKTAAVDVGGAGGERVELYLDAIAGAKAVIPTLTSETDETDSWSGSMDLTGLAGTHTITAKWYDGSTLLDTDAVTVALPNLRAHVEFTTPAPDAVVEGAVPVSGLAGHRPISDGGGAGPEVPTIFSQEGMGSDLFTLGTTTYSFDAGAEGWTVANEAIVVFGQNVPGSKQFADSDASAKWHRSESFSSSGTWAWSTSDMLDFGIYNPGIRTNLISPTLSLAGAASAKVDFQLAGNVATGDKLDVQWKLASAPDASYATIATFTEDLTDDAALPVFAARSVTFPAAALGQDVRVRFRLDTEGDPDTLLQVPWGYYVDTVAVTTVTTASPPSAPQSLVGTPVVAGVDLAWLAPADPGSSAVTGYNVYRDGAPIATVPGTSYADSGLTEIRAYAYEVGAVNSAGEGPRATVSATPLEPTGDGLAFTEPDDGATDVSGDVVLAGTYGAPPADDSRVIVAVIDNGINPYHSYYYAGSPIYPASSPPSSVTPGVLAELGIDPDHQLQLSHTGNYAADKSADSAIWARIAADRQALWWIKGTNVIVTSQGDSVGAVIETEPGEDTMEHGTGTTGAVLTANPQAIVMFVESAGVPIVRDMTFLGIGSPAEAFAFGHPAVDIISTSYGVPAGVPTLADTVGAYGGVVVGGKLHFSAAGNDPGPEPITDSTAGPWWTMSVTGFEEGSSNGHTTLSGTGADFAADYTQDLPYCIQCESGIRLVSGTSFSTPKAAGTASLILLEARRAAGHMGGIDLAETPPAMVVDGVSGDTVTNWEMRRALEEAAVYAGIADWDPVEAVFDLGSQPILDPAPWAQIGWGILTPSPDVVDETLRQLAGNPTRSKPLEACAYMSGIHQADHVWWDVGDPESDSWLTTNDPYIHCTDEAGITTSGFGPLADQWDAEIEDVEDATVPPPFDILAVDITSDDEMLFAEWSLSFLVSEDPELAPEAQNAWYDFDFRVGETEYVLEVAGDALFGDGGLGYAPSLYTANGGTFVLIASTTSFDFDWENNKFTVGVSLADIGLPTGGLIDNTWASTWPMTYAVGYDKAPNGARRASQGGLVFGETYTVDTDGGGGGGDPVGTQVKIDLDGPSGFTDVTGALATLDADAKTWTWDPAGTLPSGAYTATANEYEDAVLVRGPVSISFAVAGTVDVIPPIISGVAVSTTTTTATITWTTNEDATSLVRYGTTSAYGSTETQSGFLTSHSVTITGLTAETTYHFQVVSADAASNTAATGDATFVTQSLPPAGETVEVFLDGTTLLATIDVDTASGDDAWDLTWDSATVADGFHTLDAVFTDRDGAQAAASVRVDVDNAANHAPVFVEQDDITIAETEQVEIVVAATDEDGDPLVYTAPVRPQGSSFVPNQRRFHWTPSNNDAGDHTVQFVVSDGALTDTMDVTIHVLDKPRKPNVDPQQSSSSAPEGTLVEIVASAFDPDGDSVALTGGNLPDGGVFTDNGDGTGVFVWEPTYAQAGAYVFQVTATSPDGLYDTKDFAVTVLEGVAPVIVGETARGFTTVSAALEAIEPGQTIIIAPGTYTERVVLATDGITLCAAPPGALACGLTTEPVILDGSGAAEDGGKLDIVTVAADDVSILGITVQYLGTVPANGVTGISLGTSSGTRIEDVTISLQGGGCSLASIPAGCFTPNRVFGITADETFGAPDTGIVRNTITAQLTSDDGSIGGVDGIRGMLPDGRIADNDINGWASTGAVVWGDGLVVDGNSFRIDGTGLSVCTGDFGLEGVSVVNNEFRETFAAIALTGCRAGTGVAINDNQLGLTNSVALELKPSTTALDVDATCNDWGVYSTPAIGPRIQDDGNSNTVTVAPFTSRETGTLACLLAPTAAIASSTDTSPRNDAIVFEDSSVEGTRAIVTREWTFGDGTRTTVANPSHAYTDVGGYTVTLRVEDAAGLVSTASKEITVTNVAPILDGIGPKAGRTGDRLEFLVTATDADVEPVTLAATGLPTGAEFDPDTGTFSWTPTWAQAGSFPVSFTASDGVETDSETIDVLI